MNSRRTAKVAEAVREVVSTAILFELRDPRVQNVTVLSVTVPGDLRSAKVSVSVLGTAEQQKLCLHGLNSARGFLQRRIADRLDLRWTPVLSFQLDDAVKKSVEAARILRELAERGELGAPAEPHEPPPADQSDLSGSAPDESSGGSPPDPSSA